MALLHHHPNPSMHPNLLRRCLPKTREIRTLSSGRQGSDYLALVEHKRQNPNHLGSDFAGLVERRGFEPLTSTMRTLRATNCANAPNFLGKFCADSPFNCMTDFHGLGDKVRKVCSTNCANAPRTCAGRFSVNRHRTEDIIARNHGKCNSSGEKAYVNFRREQMREFVRKNPGGGGPPGYRDFRRHSL